MASGIAMEEVKASIQRELPSLPAPALDVLMSRLDELGATGLECLPLVTKEDLNGFLKPVYIRTLLKAWGNTGKGSSTYIHVFGSFFGADPIFWSFLFEVVQ